MARSEPVSRLAPSARLVALVLVAGAACSASPLTCLLLFLGALLLLELEGLRFSALAAELPAVALLCIFVFVIEGLGFEGGLHLLPLGLASAGVYCLRIMAALTIGRLFYQSTSSSELREAAGALGRVLPGRLGDDLALVLGLILGFIPTIIGEWDLALAAGRARGIHGGSSLAMRLRVIEAFIRRLVLRSLALPDVLMARGWTGAKGRAPSPWKVWSWVAVIGAFIFATAPLVSIFF